MIFQTCKTGFITTFLAGTLATGCLLILLTVNHAVAAEPITNVSQILEETLAQKRQESGLVGMGAVVIRDNNIIALSVSGERKKGSGTPIIEKDRWHIGSITKSFTALMIARLVENGVLDWDTPIKALFDKQSIHPHWHDVTLQQLLNHTSGAAANFSYRIHRKNPEAGIARKKAREAAVNDVLKKAPEAKADNTFLYSNIGYAIAGVMAEKKTGKVWEELIQEKIFSPLGLESAGFGADFDAAKEKKDKKEKVSQPWGHKKVLGFSVASKKDNTPIIGPAGTIHMSLKDLAYYGNEYLKGLQGNSTLLAKNTFEQLFIPKRNHYALGWVTASPLPAEMGRVFWHNGSNTRWYALLVLMPDRNTAIAVTSNDGNIQKAEQQAWQIVERLAKALSASNMGTSG